MAPTTRKVLKVLAGLAAGLWLGNQAWQMGGPAIALAASLQDIGLVVLLGLRWAVNHYRNR